MRMFAAAAALIFCASIALAAEITGNLKAVDGEKKTLTLTVPDGESTKDTTLKYVDGLELKGKKKDTPVDKIKIGKKGGPRVTVTTDDKDVVTKIVLAKKKKPAE